jgi:chorismate mutase
VADLDVYAANGSTNGLTNAPDPLEALRLRIDALDDVIVRALLDRLQLAVSATPHKDAVQDPAREAAVLEHVERFANELGGNGAAIRRLYVEILAISRELQAGDRARCTHQG